MEGPSFSDPFKKDQKPISQIGTGEGESPLASAGGPPRMPATEVRTFSSDLGSIKSSGGSEPAPYAPARPAPTAPSGPVGAPPKVPPGIAVGGTPFAKPGGMPPSMTPPPPPGGMKPSPLVPPVPPQKGGGKKVFIAILSFLIVIALGAVGYFFVYPLFVTEPPAITPPSSTPTLPESEVPETPATSEEGATSTESGTEVEEEPEVSAPDPWSGITGLSSHRSLFTTTPDATTEVILTAPTLAALRAALPSGSVASPVMREMVLTMPSGNIVPFSRIAPLLAPTFFTSERLASFDDDATYFTYAAANGTWLGIVAPLKAGVAIGPVQDGMSALQADPDLANFFLENPGEQGVWADGSVRERPTSQVSFETSDATFSYTWFDRNLLLSTNLTGADAAAARLGF